MNSEKISVRLPVEIIQHLSHLSNVTNRTKSFYIREAVERFLEEIGREEQEQERLVYLANVDNLEMLKVKLEKTTL